MKTLKDETRRVHGDGFGPDPVLMKKIGAQDFRPRDLKYFKKKILDKDYMDHAINRIAMELSHFLSR